jgi:hypothetical protein
MLSTCSQRAHLVKAVRLPVLDNLQGLGLRRWLLLLLLLLLALQTLLLPPALLSIRLVLHFAVLVLCDLLLLLAAIKKTQQA